MRAARAPLPTLGELEGVSATATLRPPGAVPPPPRALPTATPALDPSAIERALALDTPLPLGGSSAQPFTPLAGDLPPSPRVPAVPGAFTPRDATLASAPAPTKASVDASLESTLDMSGTASKKATQAALIEQTRRADGAPAPRTSPVPAPGLFIADAPLEPRPKLASLVTAQTQQLTRMRVTSLVLGGLLLMAAGALVVMFMRRAERLGGGAAAPVVSASAAPTPPGCALLAPPSRISPIERSVPISALVQPDGTIALGVADTKTSVRGWLYDPLVGEPKRKLEAPTSNAEVSHVTASEPMLVDHDSADFAFAQSLSAGLALGVGPTGLLRRGSDGATGVVWPLGTGVRVTPPRAISLPGGHFVALRAGGAEGEILTGWLRPDGSAVRAPTAIEGAPKTLGTPNVSLFGEQALVLFSARADKAEPYRIYAAVAAQGQAPGPARALELPSEGAGGLTPSLAALPNNRYLAQWTDGQIGKYRVHVRVLDATLQPVSEPLQVSGKGANAGQGMVVTTATATVSFFIQTTAGNDELWGATLTCH